MRIIFMGTPEFAVASLDKLVRNRMDIVAVVTAPDRPAGRGQQVQQSPVKEYATSRGLPVLQPERLRDEAFLQDLRSYKADLQIVVAFRMLPEAVWDMPPIGTYNLHASLLPRYRGAAPINWAIINGDKETGVTTFKLKHEIDTGAVLLQQRVRIRENMNAGELHDLLKFAGADLLLESVKLIESAAEHGKPLHFLPQDERLSTHAPKIFKDTCAIKWANRAEEINNLVRGLSPAPAAFTSIVVKEGEAPQLLKIYETTFEKTSHALPFGTVHTDHKTFIKVACGGGFIYMRELQLQGKKKMKTTDFLRGFRLTDKSRMI